MEKSERGNVESENRHIPRIEIYPPGSEKHIPGIDIVDPWFVGNKHTW